MQTNVSGAENHRRHHISDSDDDDEETTLANTVKVGEGGHLVREGPLVKAR